MIRFPRIFSDGFALNFSMFILMMLLTATSLSIGRNAGPVLDTLITSNALSSGLIEIILLEVRLPRTLLALLTGATLGLTGAALQGLFRNPLAEPGVIGVSSSAVLGAVMVLYYGIANNLIFALPAGGIAGAVVGLLFLYLLAGKRCDITTLILAGVAISAISSAATSLALNMAPSPYAALEILFWLMGSVADRSMDQVWVALPFMAVGAILLLTTGRGLDALSIGEKGAQSLGVNLNTLRFRIIAGTALSVGAAVSVTGAIGFIGLVVPHLLRPLARHQPGKLLIPSALGGACLLMAADIVVRLMPPGPELKLGVITAMIGAPFFLWLVFHLREGR